MALNATASMPRADHTQSTLWKKYSQDSDYETGKDGARDIGHVRNNYSRLNMISSLNKGDSEDWFSFNVITKGKLRFSIKSYSAETKTEDQAKELNGLEQKLEDTQEEADALRAKNMRVEVYREVKGRLVLYASNDEKAGKANDKFEQLISGEDKVTQTGKMYIKISRLEKDDPLKTVENYTVQVQMGDTYKHDYVTIEQQSANTPEKGKNKVSTTAADIALANASKNALITATQSASDMLSAGASNLKAIGTKNNGIANIFNLLV